MLFDKRHCVLIFLVVSTAVAGDNRYRPMAESMLDMMDAFSSALQKRRGGESYSSSDMGPTWIPAPYQWGNPSTSVPGHQPWGLYPNPPASQGWWQLQPPASAPNRFGAPSAWWPGIGASAVPHGLSQLEGDWQGRTGEILSIKKGHFRIYRNPSQMRQGRIRLLSRHKMLLHSSANSSIEYEYALNNDRLVLRDPGKNLLLFRRKGSW